MCAIYCIIQKEFNGVFYNENANVFKKALGKSVLLEQLEIGNAQQM